MSCFSSDWVNGRFVGRVSLGWECVSRFSSVMTWMNTVPNKFLSCSRR
ncbi:hypothetical protein BH10ACT6_BH10ACT6_06450 [soil metagenome]